MGSTRRRFVRIPCTPARGWRLPLSSSQPPVRRRESGWHKARARRQHLRKKSSPAPTVDWMTNTPATLYRAYRSRPAKTADATTWVQIDLGLSHKIDLIKIYPANEKGKPGLDAHWAGKAFPVRFKIESADEPDFTAPNMIVDQTAADFANPEGRIQKYEAAGARGRYVRFTATRLPDLGQHGIYLALGKIEVFSGSVEVATLRKGNRLLRRGGQRDVQEPGRFGHRSRRAPSPHGRVRQTMDSG